MKRLALLCAVLTGCSSTPKVKPPPPPPLCVQIDGTEALVTYGSPESAKTLVADFSKRLGRYLTREMREYRIPIARSENCNPSSDTILSLRLNTVKPTYAGTFSTLVRFRAVDVKVSYQFTLTAPAEASPREDFDDERQAADVDKLAQEVASKVAGWTYRSYAP